jgi:hypothetical protein
MVELAEIGLILQTISVMSAATAAVIGVRSYIVSNRRAEEARAMELETRRAQLYMSLTDHWNTKEFSKIRYDSYSMDWTDYDDFHKKYNSSNNADIYASWNTFGRSILGLADLKRKGLIDLNFLDGMMLTDTMNWWAYFGSMEKEMWEIGRPGRPDSLPFIMEVIEYYKKNRPFFFDENGNYKSRASKPWVKPEEMRPLMEKLNIK